MNSATRGIALAFAVAAVGCTKAGPPVATAVVGDLRIENGFAYEPITDASGAAYFRIHNTGTTADTVLEASSPAARAASFHGSSMAHLDALEIPAGGDLELKPGATHLMFTDFTAAPKAGDSLTITLRFAKAGSVTLKLPVRRYGQ